MLVAQGLLQPFRSSHVRAKLPSRFFASVGTPQQTSSSSNLLSNIILTQGVVRPGYGRGSKTLGFPTANLPDFDAQLQQNGVKTGIYYGWASIAGEKELFPCVSNIGISPTFVGEENAGNIVEAYVLERPRGRGDFYGSLLRLALIGYIRPEMKFNNIGELVRSIKADVTFTKKACAAASGAEPERLAGADAVQLEDRAQVQQAQARKLYSHCVRPFLETTDPEFQYTTALSSSSSSSSASSTAPQISLESSFIQSARQRDQTPRPTNTTSSSVSVSGDRSQFLCAISIDAILSQFDAAH